MADWALANEDQLDRDGDVDAAGGLLAAARQTHERFGARWLGEPPARETSALFGAAVAMGAGDAVDAARAALCSIEVRRVLALGEGRGIGGASSIVPAKGSWRSLVRCTVLGSVGQLPVRSCHECLPWLLQLIPLRWPLPCCAR
jgi:hypothetical protein